MANTYYVAPTDATPAGNDASADGTDPLTPFAHAPGGVSSFATGNSLDVVLVDGDIIKMKREGNWIGEPLCLIYEKTGLTISSYYNDNGTDDETKTLPIWNVYRDMTDSTWTDESATYGIPVYSTTASTRIARVRLGNTNALGGYDAAGGEHVASPGREFMNPGLTDAQAAIALSAKPHFVYLFPFGETGNHFGTSTPLTEAADPLLPAVGEWGWRADNGGELRIGSPLTMIANPTKYDEYLWAITLSADNPWHSGQDINQDKKLFIYSDVGEPDARYETVQTTMQRSLVVPAITDEGGTDLRDGTLALYIGASNNCIVENIQFIGGTSKSGNMEARGVASSGNRVWYCEFTETDASGGGFSMRSLTEDNVTYLTDCICEHNLCDSMSLVREETGNVTMEKGGAWPLNQEGIMGDGMGMSGGISNCHHKYTTVRGMGHNFFGFAGKNALVASLEDCSLIGNTCRIDNSPYCRGFGVSIYATNGKVRRITMMYNDFTTATVGSALAGEDHSVMFNLFSADQTPSRLTVSVCLGLGARDLQDSDNNLIVNNIFLRSYYETITISAGEVGWNCGTSKYYNNVLLGGARNLTSETLRYKPNSALIADQDFDKNIFWTPDGARSGETGEIINWTDGVFQLEQNTIAEMDAHVEDTWGTNYQLEPTFEDFEGGDYRLALGSIGVGIGKKFWDNGPRPTALNGEPLPDTGIDISAYQSTLDVNHPANL